MVSLCKDCGSSQWARFDQAYLETFGHCWDCDRLKADQGFLSQQDFKHREHIVSKQIN